MKKVFILDDNEELLDIMDRILSPQFTVVVSNDRGSAMSMIDEFMPDMFILDYFIGNNTADDIVEQLQSKDSPSSIPVILFSASPEIEEVANRLGVTGFLEKPSSISKIREYIENVAFPPQVGAETPMTPRIESAVEKVPRQGVPGMRF